MPKLPNLLQRFVRWLEEPEAAPPQPPPEPTFLERMAQQAASKGEKRASSRKSVRIAAELSDSIKGLRSSVTVEDLSNHGLYLTAGYALIVGSMVEISLEFPEDFDGGSGPATLLARITRVDRKPDGGFGIAALITRRKSASPPSRTGRN